MQAIVEELRARGYWAHLHTDESGEEVARTYAAQRRVYETDPGGKNQPRLFFTDRAWWLYSARFYHVNPHLQAEISYPEGELEKELPEQPVDWLYRFGSDARGRLLPELAKAIAGSNAGSDLMAARIEGKKYLEKYYAELIPSLVYCIPQFDRFPHGGALRMPRSSFESRLRSFRARWPLPDKLTAQTMLEYLISLGICEHTHNYYLRFSITFAAGLIELKNTLTHAAIRDKLTKKE